MNGRRSWSRCRRRSRRWCWHGSCDNATSTAPGRTSITSAAIPTGDRGWSRSGWLLFEIKLSIATALESRSLYSGRAADCEGYPVSRRGALLLSSVEVVTCDIHLVDGTAVGSDDCSSLSNSQGAGRRHNCCSRRHKGPVRSLPDRAEEAVRHGRRRKCGSEPCDGQKHRQSQQDCPPQIQVFHAILLLTSLIHSAITGLLSGSHQRS